MRKAVNWAIVLTSIGIVSTGVAIGVPPAQGASAQSAEAALPPDVNPDSRNRLPPIDRDVEGAAAIRLHASGVAVRWESPLGRALTELAILTTAREHDQPYEWSLHEMEALAVGLDPATIDLVRDRRPVAGLAEEETVIIRMGREIFRTHELSSDTYARALEVLGRSNLVDVVTLMGSYAATAGRLTAFNQHMPPGWKQFLPLPFALPDDIHPDSRSRLPLIRSETSNPQSNLYGRQLAPEGTGPGHIRRHGAGVASLEAGVGRRMRGLAALVTAREYDAQYDWTMTEAEALGDGLDPAIIDVVRHRGALTGLADRERTLIQFGRELFATRNVRPDTYARALKTFGERDLVGIVDLMAQHVADAVLLAAFDQHLPAGRQPLLPIAAGAR